MANEKNLTPELLEKAKSASSATALLALAQENGITLTTEEVTAYYTQLHLKEGALSDEELDNVAGGICGDGRPCAVCTSTNTKGGFGGTTVTIAATIFLILNTDPEFD